MPNAKILSEKQAIVAELTEKLQNASSGVLVDYKGITVAEDTALRTECRNNELDYAVVKNTLLRFAAKNVGLDDLDSVLNGTTSLATSDADPIAPMRIVNKYAKQLNGKFNIKGKAIYAQNTSHLIMVSGFGATDYDPQTGSYDHAPIRSAVSWLNATYGSKWRAGLFLGYVKNLGAKKDFISTNDFWMRGAKNTDYIYQR